MAMKNERARISQAERGSLPEPRRFEVTEGDSSGREQSWSVVAAPLLVTDTISYSVTEWALQDLHTRGVRRGFLRQFRITISRNTSLRLNHSEGS